MNEDRLSEYKLHSKGDNWFHFRVKPNEYNESFSVTYCHDGTVCMTGDMGTLTFQRLYFPDKYTFDYGFPNKETGIGYFAEKVGRADASHQIKTWDVDVARDDIKEAIETYTEYEDCKKELEVLNDVLGAIDGFESGEYGRIQMIEAFYNETHQIESEDFLTYGDCYTESFKMRFKMLQSVVDIIINEVQ